MATRVRKPNWSRITAKLRRGVAAGDVVSTRDLGLSVAEGIQDQNGRSLVRRNPAYAVRLLRRAAESGDPTAAGSLGYAYDVGNGIRRNRALALKWYRRAARMGDAGAAANVATVYRGKGELRLAHKWALRAMRMGDGDAAVTAGYGYLHGVGVHRDIRVARRLLRLALRGNTSDFGREEALYNLALAEVDRSNPLAAIPLLRHASRDGDYPEAASLLTQIRAKADLRPCRCRRHLSKHLRGHAYCPQHPDLRASSRGKRY